MIRFALSLYLLTTSILCNAIHAAEDPVAQATVKLSVSSAKYDFQKPWLVHSPRRSYGSGCVIAGNTIITNAHVVANAKYIEVQRHNDAKKWKARVRYAIHDADLAFVDVDDPDFFVGITPLDLAEADLPEPQSDVLVHGFPMGGSGLSITKGVVSRVEPNTYAHSGIYLMAAQIDAPINPGNSGGPVSQNGQLIGVVMQGYRFSDGLGYMVPLQIIRHVMSDLEDQKHNGFPNLGMRYQYLESPSHKASLNLAADVTGVVIAEVLKGSSASGLIDAGDVITKIDNYSIADDGTTSFMDGLRIHFSHHITYK